jgi:hypothetical protein
MKARTCLLTCALIALAGCTTAGEDDKPIECQPKGTKISWGPCDAEERLAYDTVSSLGFSPNDVLDTIAGTYEFPIAWFDPCNADAPCAQFSVLCEYAPERAVPTFAGTVTVLTVELEATGDPALAATPGPEPWQVCCPTHMSIPGRLALRTADGALEGVHDVMIGSDDGAGASVFLKGPASIMGGALAEELPEGATVELGVCAFDDRASLSLNFFPPGSDDGGLPLPLLQEEIRSDVRCPPDVPIDDVRKTGP